MDLYKGRIGHGMFEIMLFKTPSPVVITYAVDPSAGRTRTESPTVIVTEKGVQKFRVKIELHIGINGVTICKHTGIGCVIK